METNKERLLSTVTNHKKSVVLFFVIFYVVGFIGMVVKASQPLFIKLIPLALILSFVAIALFHVGKIDRKTAWCFILIYLVSFSIEATGVLTGKIFGNYSYGDALGFKLIETPLIIGLNWLFLVYTTSAFFERFKLPIALKIVFASMAMVVYDIVLEQLASKLDMWHWQDDIIPLQNYTAWFAVSIILHTLVKTLNVKIENSMATILLACQFLFFLLLYIFI